MSLWEIEQLVKLGNIRGPCPFYLAREMARTADLVFMPYNYLIDSKNRAGLNMLRLENSILIFDEAHNVEVSSKSSMKVIHFLASTQSLAVPEPLVMPEGYEQ